MSVNNRKEAIVLLLGDIILLYFGLWLTLFARHGRLPDSELLLAHIVPFSFIFLAWLTVFFVAGLYGSHTLIFKRRLPGLLFKSQIVNSITTVVFFYVIPYFGITPKTILFIYLVISFGLVLFWRLYGFSAVINPAKENAIIIGRGEELKEIFYEVNYNPRYSMKFISSIDTDALEMIDFQSEIVERVYSENVTLFALDLHNEKIKPFVPHLYNLIFSGVHFVDMHKMYEDIWGRVPLSLVKYNWFLENISSTPKSLFDVFKRSMDILVSIPLLFVPAVCFPFVFVAMKLEDGGGVWSVQERVGKNNLKIKILKFRTMTVSNDFGQWGKVQNKVTRVGNFLRRTRLDEFPQLWNVLKGDISLIGPRPEFAEAVKHYTDEIPYYNVRHLIKPGLSGWAQLYHENHPHHKADVSETKVKLSYDLYYIKNRSFWLDFRIALQTVRTLLSRSGM
ncbi:MAG: sugar transferase [bacterium]|nr:sugar transferase [bacterium]